MNTSAIVPSTVATAWTAYTNHVSQHWRLPDLESVSICLAATAAHNSPADPVSLFIIGPPGSGKTSININTLWSLPNTHIIGNLSTKALYSKYKNCSNPGLLQQLPLDATGRATGIFLFKDFTTMISKSANDQMDIMAQLREIADGYWSDRGGVGAEPTWRGKVTMFAACTHAIDRAWTIRTELGERFLALRIITPLEGALWEAESLALASSAQEQVGGEPVIVNRMKELAREFMQVTPSIPKTPPELRPDQKAYINRLGHFACLARRVVHRGRSTGGEISDIDPRESPTRLAKGLSTIARWHAALFRKEAVDATDLRMAYRIAKDTIPMNRWSILSALHRDGTTAMPTGQLLSLSNIPRTTFQRLIADMTAIDLIREETNAIGDNSYRLSPLSVSNLTAIEQEMVE